jgi:ABC-type bacteriocin/lantibiotic exporter with double-glycine peptidase domain
MEELVRFARTRGFSARGYSGSWDDLPPPGRPPVLAHLARGHYVVVHDATPERIVYFDPERGAVLNAARSAFESEWSGYFMSVSTLSEDELRRQD